MKYRQRGYRESDQRDRDRDRDRSPRKPPAQRALSPEQQPQIRSLRRATDRNAREVVRCPNCGRNVEQHGAIGPETRCPGCRASIRCCRTCRHFDTGARFQCRATIEERVPDKNSANRCPQFLPRLVLDSTGKRSAPAAGASNDPKAAFENLFKR